MSDDRLTKAERRRLRKLERRERQRNGKCQITDVIDDERRQIRKSRPLEARTETQVHYILSILNNKLTFGLGPAGTGKTYVCAVLAAEALAEKRTERVILTRPAVEAGESLGFLPGGIDEKFEPYIAPFREILSEKLSVGTFEYMLKAKKIECVPLAYMRGRTFNDCWVILDEAQNTTPTQMKMFLTRIGEGTTVVVNGDITQKDIAGESGLTDAVQRLRRSRYVSTIKFSDDDVVRSGLVRDILMAYRE